MTPMRTHRRTSAPIVATGLIVGAALFAACGSSAGREGTMIASPIATCTSGASSTLTDAVSSTATARFAWATASSGTMSSDVLRSGRTYSAPTPPDATGLTVTMLNSSGASLGTALATCATGTSTKRTTTTTAPTVATLPVVTTTVAP